MPPTAEQVEAFVSDRNPQAYGQLVDRLLESPRYGVHAGDVIGWTSCGLAKATASSETSYRKNAWPFRDYADPVVEIPISRSTSLSSKHLVGDVVGDTARRSLGVAFLTLGPYDDVGNQDVVAAANIRATTVDDMVAATGSAFLGLTIDGYAPAPSSQVRSGADRGNYRVKAAFDGVSHAARPLATNEMRRSHQQQAVQPLNEEKKRLTEERERIETAILARAEQAGPAHDSSFSRQCLPHRGHVCPTSSQLRATQDAGPFG